MGNLQILDENKDSVTSLDVSDYEILVGSADAKVRRYDIRNGQLLTGKCLGAFVWYDFGGEILYIFRYGGILFCFIRLLHKRWSMHFGTLNYFDLTI